MEKSVKFVLIVLSLWLTVELGSAKPNNVEYACDPVRLEALGLDAKSLAFCDSSLPLINRAKDLVGRLTLHEKVMQMGNTATGILRLGVPKYEWWSEALHGVSNTGPGVVFGEPVPAATSFPLVILTSASFNESLWKAIGEVVSTEARAIHNVGTAGLTYWSPNINVLRDPRWGRAMETSGEDPFVVGKYAENYVRGLQDTDDKSSDRLKVAACCKHYTAYDVDNWKAFDRFHFDAHPTEQDMLDTFQPPFEMCVKNGDVSSVMCSYNRVNGIPTCSDSKLLKDTIRGQWNLNGYIVSDCDSIQVLFEEANYTKTPEEAVASVLRAGLDLDCGQYYTKYTQSAVIQGKLKESDVDNALVNLYVVLMRLGFFDGHIKHYSHLGAKDVCSAEHQELAVEAAREGIVLLENDGSLPLSSRNITNVAVIGPHANATSAMIGNYAGIPCQMTSPIKGLAKYASVVYEPGCSDVACNDTSLIGSAVHAAKKADATVLFVGIDLSVEAESLDRDSLLLPGYQMDLVSHVANASKGPVIVVIMSAGPIDVSFAKNLDKISGMVWVGYPGQGGGHAIAQTIFGNNNPGGRLPMTWYPNKYVENVNMTNLHMRANPSTGYAGRTYRFYKGETVYPFGYGLSYTNFTYSLKSMVPPLVLNLQVPKNQKCHSAFEAEDPVLSQCPSIRIDESESACKTSNVELEIQVENNGERDGSDVVLVYAVPPPGLSGAPEKHLVAFTRVFVKAGATETVSIKLNVCDKLGIVDNAAYRVLAAGEHSLLVGHSIKAPLIVSLLP